MPNSLLSQLESNGAPQKDANNVLCIQIDGFVAFIGKNAFSNERMISEHKERHDKCLWLHALAAGGSHVILCVDGKDPVPDEVIKQAAKLALEYSRSRGTTVRLARLETLFKPEGAGAGVWRAKHFTTLEAI